jgi:glycosyltransferase involved in cell wall biosynthesis
MKIGIYTPYLDTLGGGERYMLTFAEYCLQRGWEVELFWEDEETVYKASQRLNLRLNNLVCNSRIFKGLQEDASYASKIQKWWGIGGYDLIFFLSDGSIPNLRAKQNWLHFQVPFQLQSDSWTRKKLTKINRVICNSKFTKKFIDASFGVNSEVIYPPVSVHDFSCGDVKKENIILSVGRFDQIMNAKRQDVLVEIFKQMVDEGLPNWKLVLAGGQQHNNEYLLKLRELSIGYPVEIQENVAFKDLLKLYKQASVYWHAAGFGVNENKEPDKVEHFGISIVEAMAAGCIPIAFAAGGIKEIISDKENGYFWKNEKQLKEMTLNMIDDISKQERVVVNAQKRAHDFSKEVFFCEFEKRLY